MLETQVTFADFFGSRSSARWWTPYRDILKHHVAPQLRQGGGVGSWQLAEDWFRNLWVRRVALVYNAAMTGMPSRQNGYEVARLQLKRLTPKAQYYEKDALRFRCPPDLLEVCGIDRKSSFA